MQIEFSITIIYTHTQTHTQLSGNFSRSLLSKKKIPDGEKLSLTNLSSNNINIVAKGLSTHLI